MVSFASFIAWTMVPANFKSCACTVGTKKSTAINKSVNRRVTRADSPVPESPPASPAELLRIANEILQNPLFRDLAIGTNFQGQSQSEHCFEAINDMLPHCGFGISGH
jgi:hypothetical protein